MGVGANLFESWVRNSIFPVADFCPGLAGGPRCLGGRICGRGSHRTCGRPFAQLLDFFRARRGERHGLRQGIKQGLSRKRRLSHEYAAYSAVCP